MKVSELEGIWLDYWVAKAEGYPLSCDWNQEEFILVGAGEGDDPLKHYAPSTCWQDGGPIIERKRINLGALTKGWKAFICNRMIYDGEGKTPLIAAMRCYVTMKFGDEVPNER